MADVRIIDLDLGSVNDNHLFESDDGNASFKITAIDLRAYCQNGLTPQSIGIAAGVTTTELNYLDGVTSGVQGQIDAKAPINNPTFTGTVSGITKAMVGLNLVDNTSDINKPISTLQQIALDEKAFNSRVIATASGLSGGGDLKINRTIALNISALQSKTTPSILDEVLIYDPVSLSHKRTTVSGITGYSGGGGGVTAHGALTGLNNDDHPQYSLANGTRWAADQTANRVAISTASGVLASSSITTTQLEYLSDVTSVIQAQINAKAPINNPTFTGTVSGVTKAMVGLNLVDNTSDANKPISALQQAGLDLKAPNSRVVATASGLTGGGDLSADRTIALNIPGLQTKANPVNVDQLLIYGISESAHRVTTVSGLTSGLQPLLISAINIKTINNTSVLGSGNIDISGGGGSSPTITTLPDAATVTPNVDTTTIGILNSLSQDTTIANPTGTPVNYQELVLRITSSSIRRIAWGSAYAGLLPNTTSGGGIEDYFYFRYNTLDTKWDLVQTNQPSDEVELSYLVSTLILTGNL